MWVRDLIRYRFVTLSYKSLWRYGIWVCVSEMTWNDVRGRERRWWHKSLWRYEMWVRWREMTWEDVTWREMTWDMKCECVLVRWRERTWHDIIILAAASITMDTQCSSVRSRILVIIFKSFKWWHWDDVIFDCRVMSIASNCGSVSSWYWNVMVGCRFVTGRSHHLSLIQLTARWHHHHIIRSHHLSLKQLATCISLHIITNSKPTKYHKLT